MALNYPRASSSQRRPAGCGCGSQGPTADGLILRLPPPPASAADGRALVERPFGLTSADEIEREVRSEMARRFPGLLEADSSVGPVGARVAGAGWPSPRQRRAGDPAGRIGARPTLTRPYLGYSYPEFEHAVSSVCRSLEGDPR